MRPTQIIETNEHTNKKVYYNFKSYAAAKEQLINFMHFYKRSGRYSKIILKLDKLTLYHGDSDNITTIYLNDI